MKLTSAIILASAGSACAFAPTSSRSATVTRINSSPIDEESVENVMEAAAPVAPTESQMSQSLPFMERPAALDGTLAGDVGFDPLGFAKTKEDLMNYREAEIKHGRLAMLAAAGWPISELFDRKLANTLDLSPVVDAQDRAPSLLNGGLGKVSPVYWAVCIAAAAAIDLYGINRSKKASDYTPGDLGFDPLGAYPKEADAQTWFKTAEIKNGRLAMIAITAFAVQEFVSKVPVVNETPLFFKPIGTTLHEYANSGYIQ